MVVIVIFPAVAVVFVLITLSVILFVPVHILVIAGTAVVRLIAFFLLLCSTFVCVAVC